MSLLNLLAMVLQLSVVLIGFPAQVSRNYDKNENGEVSTKLYLVFSTFMFRFISTSIDGIWYVFVPDILAILIIGVTLSQIKYPRNSAARMIHTIYRFGADLKTR